MGSPYLMAHGLGFPVKDASTMVTFPKVGIYYMHVRTRNWAARWSNEDAPGKFQISVDDKRVDQTFGTKEKDWTWISGGKIEIRNKQVKISLHDLTGFNGRCDAILFTSDESYKPVNDVKALDDLRIEVSALAKKARQAGKYDLVVIGGGMGGICTAISAARLGIKVAMVQNRPVLGGNNSSEVRVHLGARIRQEPWPNIGNLVNEIGPLKVGNAEPKENYEDDKKQKAVLAEENISRRTMWIMLQNLDYNIKGY